MLPRRASRVAALVSEPRFLVIGMHAPSTFTFDAAGPAPSDQLAHASTNRLAREMDPDGSCSMGYSAGKILRFHELVRDHRDAHAMDRILQDVEAVTVLGRKCTRRGARFS